MLSGRRAGRRVWIVLAAVAALASMAYAAVALAASDTIVAGPSEAFDHQPAGNPYNTDQGVVVSFQDQGGTHNVTARQAGPDGKPLFQSPTISGGSAGVSGTQYLTPGDYQFFCTVHPTTMSGTLHVTGAGTAVARPHLDLTVRTKNVSKALQKGILVGLNASAKIDGVAVAAKVGKTTVGQTTFSLAAGQQVDVLKLNKAGKSLLRSRGRATVTVSAVVPFGSPASAKGKLK